MTQSADLTRAMITELRTYHRTHQKPRDLRWSLNREGAMLARRAKDASGNYLWLMLPGQDDTILGLPFIIAPEQRALFILEEAK